MFEQLFPQRVDNTYHGHKLAFWLFGLVVLVKSAISVNSIFNGFFVATSADGIPLATYSSAGAQAFVSLFALWGLSHLMICLLCILVLIRYRGFVPLMFTLLLVEHLGRKLILQIIPIAKTGMSHGFAINLVLVVVMIVGLALSLWSRNNAQAQP